MNENYIKDLYLTCERYTEDALADDFCMRIMGKGKIDSLIYEAMSTDLWLENHPVVSDVSEIRSIFANFLNEFFKVNNSIQEVSRDNIIKVVSKANSIKERPDTEFLNEVLLVYYYLKCRGNDEDLEAKEVLFGVLQQWYFNEDEHYSIVWYMFALILYIGAISCSIWGIMSPIKSYLVLFGVVLLFSARLVDKMRCDKC